jgi:hypothetical protein
VKVTVTGGYQMTAGALAAQRLGVEFLQLVGGGGLAKCIRHNELINVSSLDFIDKDLVTIAREALSRCSKCIEEIQAVMPPTRWPEGAEL